MAETVEDADREKSHREVWEEIYAERRGPTSGKPGRMLEQQVTALLAGSPPGTALELGCGKGDDAIWLARQGFTVTAVDLSQTALDFAAANAGKAGFTDRINFARHDLAETFPTGVFDLVTSCFMQSPVDFPRAAVLKRATRAVAPGGHLLIIEHGSNAPWSSAPPDTKFPTPAETLPALELDDSWQQLVVDAVPRTATGPDGQTAEISDNVILVRRFG